MVRPAVKPPSASVWSLPVLVAALGYFVDIYDIVLIGMVGRDSLLSLGVPPEQVVPTIGHLLGLQMVGMLIGGFLWGMIADKWGRVATLFGSIVTYSTATLLNGFVTDLWQYEVLRVVAGIGLAGELGVGITLVVECLPQAKRAYGATVVACLGIAGALVAWVLTKYVSWQTAFVIGGLMGFALLGLRWLSHESGLFAEQGASLGRGSLRLLFGTRDRCLRYAQCLALGLPTWFLVGIFVFLGAKTAEALGVVGPVLGKDAIVACYTGLIVGDFVAGFLTSWLESRRKAVGLFLLAAALTTAFILLFVRGWSATAYLVLCGWMGFTVGFWALFVTIAAEQFGTNLRATVATTVPNVARGAFYPMQWLIFALAPDYGYLPVLGALAIVVFALALTAVVFLKETHGTDLSFQEELS